MRTFLVFLAVIAVIGVVWLALPIFEQRNRDHETRVVAAAQLVEEAIIGSSADILRVDLFSPDMAPLAGDGRWQLTGIMATQDRTGRQIHVRYAAVVTFTCLPYAEPTCGKITTLTIDNQPLVIDGAVVAELQEVLRATAEAQAGSDPGAGDAGAMAPGGTSEPATILAPQLETTEVPAPETVESGLPPAPEAPAPEPMPVPEPTAAPTLETVAPDGTPIQGDRLIFLTQKRLKEMGYDPGPVDGQVGPRTTSAIQVYQRRAGMAVDGQPSAALLEHMSHATPAAAQ